MINKVRNPIEQLTDALAAMTERAMTAENEKEDANARSLEWYRKFEQKDKEHKEMQTILSDEIQAHLSTKAELEEAYRVIGELNDELNKLKTPQKSHTEP